MDPLLGDEQRDLFLVSIGKNLTLIQAAFDVVAFGLFRINHGLAVPVRANRGKGNAAGLCGPVATMVTGSGDSRSTFAISSGAESAEASNAGSGSAGPSRPDSPWTDGAFITSFRSGCGQPFPTGACRPMSVQTRSAL